MITTCKRCKNYIPSIDFTEEKMLELWGLVYQDLKLFAVKKLIDELGTSHRDAKTIVDHMNGNYGKCRRCNFEELDGENVECPKCGTFNYNIKEPVFNQDFCSLLEYSIPFDQLEDESVRNFWCDGVDPIPFDIKNLALENLKLHRRIKTRAWTGVSGQEIYEMTIHFGNKSIKCFEQKLSLDECIYSENADNWVKVNPDEKTIEIKLK
jgi:hypothetical protein